MKPELAWNFFSRIFIGMIAACMLIIIGELAGLPGWLGAFLIACLSFAGIVIFGVDAILKAKDQGQKTLAGYRAALAAPDGGADPEDLEDFTQEELAAIMKYKTKGLLRQAKK